jgi:hypothetical protein
MQSFKEFQVGWLLFAVLVPIHILIIYLSVNSLGDRPITNTGFIIVNSIFIVIYLLFYGMKTIVNSEWIVISFGVGIISKRIQVEKIESVKPVENPWYYGAGIRFIPGGTLYNIRGVHAVELKFYNMRDRVRIGTNNPTQLMQEIIARLPKSQGTQRS